MTGLMRAAIYARYSSELQRDASIEDQVRACLRRRGGRAAAAIGARSRGRGSKV
jgi:hypothetical protein